MIYYSTKYRLNLHNILTMNMWSAIFLFVVYTVMATHAGFLPLGRPTRRLSIDKIKEMGGTAAEVAKDTFRDPPKGNGILNRGGMAAIKIIF